MNNHSEKEFDAIESLLIHTQPIVDQEFEHRLEAQLTTKLKNVSEEGKVEQKTLLRRPPHNFSFPRRFILGLVTILLLIAAIVFIPPVRSAALEIIQYFTRTVNEVVRTQYTVVNPDSTESVDINANKVANLQEASERAGFRIKSPAFLPESFTLDVIHAKDGGAFLHYKDLNEHGGLSIQQYELTGAEPVITCGMVYVAPEDTVNDSGEVTRELKDQASAISNDCDELGDIGSNAEVHIVQIGEVTGEYVAGGWTVSPFELEPSLNEAQPGENLEYSFIWDPNLPQYQLRWHENGIGYDLNLTLYGEEISMEEVVKIAASMQ